MRAMIPYGIITVNTDSARNREFFMESSEKDNGDELLAARVLALRESLGMSTRAFAEAVGVSQPTQSRIERAKRMPDALYLRRLRERFQVDINALLLGDAAGGAPARAHEAPPLPPRAEKLLANWKINPFNIGIVTGIFGIALSLTAVTHTGRFLSGELPFPDWKYGLFVCAAGFLNTAGCYVLQRSMLYGRSGVTHNG